MHSLWDTFREVVKMHIVEAQCSVQLCFPVELDKDNMVGKCTSYFELSISIIFPKLYNIFAFSCNVDGRCSFGQLVVQASGEECYKSNPFGAWEGVS